MDLLPRSYWNGTLDLPILSRGYGTLVGQATAQDLVFLWIYHKNRRISTMQCTPIFGFGSYPLRLTYEIPSKFHPRFPPISFHVPQNSTHSSPSNTRCQNQNQSSPFDIRCQMILILTLTLDLAHCLHC